MPIISRPFFHFKRLLVESPVVRASNTKEKRNKKTGLPEGPRRDYNVARFSKEDHPMSTWQEKNAALLAELAETPNPSVRGNAIGYYLRDARKDHKLTLYEQYVLETEKLSYERLAWTQPGWSRRTGISDLIKVLNVKMMALLFQEKEAAEIDRKSVV